MWYFDILHPDFNGHLVIYGGSIAPQHVTVLWGHFSWKYVFILLPFCNKFFYQSLETSYANSLWKKIYQELRQLQKMFISVWQRSLKYAVLIYAHSSKIDVFAKTRSLLSPRFPLFQRDSYMLANISSEYACVHSCLVL